MTHKKCKHKWVDMEDGTLDQFCVKCRKFQMQAVLNPLTIDAGMSNSLPIMRETMKVPFYNGSEHSRVTVNKDDLLKQVNRELGVPGALMNGIRW